MHVAIQDLLLHNKSVTLLMSGESLMATIQTQASDELKTEFVLAGRFWASVSVTVICFIAAVYMYGASDHPWVGLRWFAWRAMGVSFEQRQALSAAFFTIVALGCFVWTLIGPRLARRVVITSTHIRIYRAQLGSSDPVVIPFVAVRDAGQRELPPGNRRSEWVHRADRYFHFDFNGQDFDFRRFAFQSDRDFKRFCELIVDRINNARLQ